VSVELADLAQEILTGVTLSPSQWAATVTLPDGDKKGQQYSPTIHPAQACVFAAADAGASHLTIVKPVQDGGSLVAFLLMLHRVCALGQTAIMAYPTLTAARDAWTKKLAPILTAIDKMPTSGGGSGGGAASVLQLPGGGSVILRAAGGRHESGQASATGDVLIPDEADDWPDIRRLKLIEQRITKSQDPLVVFISTVKRDGEGKDASHILRIHDEGTRTRLEYPCPYCQKFQTLEWERVNLESAQIACEGCGVLLTERERLAMLPLWRRKDQAKSEQFSIMWTSLDSPFPIVISGKKRPILQGLCDEWKYAERQAELGDHSFARQFYRDRLCRPYRKDLNRDEDGQTIIPTTNRLAALASQSKINLDVDRREKDGDSVHLIHLPAECEHQALGVDVQRGGDRAPPRLYFALLGSAPAAARRWLTGWGTIALGPMGRQATDGEIMAGLDRLRDLLDDWAPAVPIVRRMVDINDGGWMDDKTKRAANAAVIRWLKQNPTWWGIRGSDPIKQEPGDIPNWIYHRMEGGLKVRYVVTLKSISTIHGEVMSGTLILPRALSEKGENNQLPAIVQHWCGTVEYEPGKWSDGKKDRKYHPEWQKRIDYLHSGAYALVGLKEWESRPAKNTTAKPIEKGSQDYGHAIW